MRWWLLLLLGAEFALFAHTAGRQAEVYPRWHDQIQPLTEAYTTYEHRREHGLWPGAARALTLPAAQGNQHAGLALLAFEVAGGASRPAALAVNIGLFLVWQAAFLIAIQRGTGSSSLPWLAAGLMLALHGPWSGTQGSATDFRLDSAAMSLMGLSLALALRTDGWRHRRWSLLVGAAVGWTILARFLTVTYFAVIFVACLGWLLAAGERRTRVLNLLLAGLVTGIVIVPSFAFHWREIYDHYWIGHYQHADGLLWDTGRSVLQVFVAAWQLLGEVQLGRWFGVAAGLALAVLAAGAWAGGALDRFARGDSRNRWIRESAVLGLIFLLAPIVVLAMQNNDRMVGVVLGVAVPGALALVIAAASALARRSPTAGGRAWPAVAAAVALIVGGIHYVLALHAQPYSDLAPAECRQVEALADRVFTAARGSGLAQPSIATDQVLDFFDGPILSVQCYERHGVWLPFTGQLPTGISRVPTTLVWERLAASDFVLATEAGPPGPWPFDEQMSGLRPQILAWCQANLQESARAEWKGRRLVLFQRRDIGVPPVILAPSRLLASTAGAFSLPIRITKGRAAFSAAGLPPGLGIDAATGSIAGRPQQPGRFAARVRAANAFGTSFHDIAFAVESGDFLTRAEAPATAPPGQPVEVTFDAFDLGGRLDFIDVTDLTSGTALARMNATESDRRNWTGVVRLTPGLPGRNLFHFRFVRLQPDRGGHYDFRDRTVEVMVQP